jgi:alanine racemase
VSRPTDLHINLDALQHNFNQVCNLAPNSKVLAMIKANAYGHGLKRVAKALQSADAFGVACLEEAKIIREVGLDNPIILMVGFFDQDDLQKIIDLNCEIIIHHLAQVEALEKVRLISPIKVWLKIDTGMHRLGVDPEQAEEIYARLIKCKNVLGTPKVLTHFADADDPSKLTTQKQIDVFEQVTANLAGEKSLANSAGILAFPQSHADWVRPGGLLYGVSTLPGDVGANHNLKPVMTLSSKIIALRKCHKNDAIGYGGIWSCPEDMPVGVVAIGYGDGYPRHARCGTSVLVNNHICPLIGRVAMDMLAVDLRSYSDAKIGDEVILWGKDLPVEKVAESSDTVIYELLCGIARRVRGAE